MIHGIESICVVGAGVMGRQIALHCAMCGITVTLTDSASNAVDSAKTWSIEYLESSVKKGKRSSEECDAAMSLLRFVNDISEAVRHVDMVIETIIENQDIKRELFSHLSEWVDDHTILVTNSSFMASSRFADLISCPGRLANLHFFTPVMRMELVEIVRGPHTSEDTIDKLKLFVKKINKTYILLNKEIEGFIVNRLIKALLDEALFLYDNGYASCMDIDLAAEKGMNHPLGPFRLMDMTGIDISYMSRKRKFDETNSPKDMPPKILEEKYLSGDFGRKTGKGWYNYTG